MDKNNSNMLVIALLVAVAFLLGMNINAMKDNSSTGKSDAEQENVLPEGIGEKPKTNVKPNEGLVNVSKKEGERPAKKEKMVKCPICKGCGTDPRDVFKKCFGCERVGLVRESEYKRLASMEESEWPYVEKVYFECPMCFGTKQQGGRSTDILYQNPYCDMCDENGMVDSQRYKEIIKLMEQMRRDGIPVNFMPPFEDDWYW